MALGRVQVLRKDRSPSPHPWVYCTLFQRFAMAGVSLQTSTTTVPTLLKSSPDKNWRPRWFKEIIPKIIFYFCIEGTGLIMTKPVLDTYRMYLCPALRWQFVLNFCFLYESGTIFWSSVKKNFRLFLSFLYPSKAIEMTGIGSREVYLYNRLFQEKLQLRQSSALSVHSKITYCSPQCWET